MSENRHTAGTAYPQYYFLKAGPLLLDIANFATAQILLKSLLNSGYGTNLHQVLGKMWAPYLTATSETFSTLECVAVAKLV